MYNPTQFICSLYQNAIITNNVKININAELLKGFPEETVDTYEFNQAYPSPDKLKKIAQFLDVPVEYFFDQYYEFVFGDYGGKIKKWQVKNRHTIKEAGVIVGVNANTLSKWKRNIRYPDRLMYRKLMKIMCK